MLLVTAEMQALNYDEMHSAPRYHPETSDDDEDTVRICHEQYGSTSGADFAACVVEAVRAINHRIFPERIPQGSSGSYFVLNMRKV
jgi:hypothetical protein